MKPSQPPAGGGSGPVGWIPTGPDGTRPRRETVQDLVDSRPIIAGMLPAVVEPDGLEVTLDVPVAVVDGRAVTAEVYLPTDPPAGPLPTVLHLHGGGWCTGSARADRAVAMRFAAAGAAVVNLDYSLAPEDPWPRALLEVVATIVAIRSRRIEAIPDAGRLVLAGFSAGANLAAAATCACLGDALPAGTDVEPTVAGPPDALALVYGIFDWAQLTAADLAIRDSISLWNRAYLGETFLRRHRDPLVSPLRSSRLGAFPPVRMVCGSRDELLDQSLGLMRALAAAGAPAGLTVVDGVDHGFVKFETDHADGARALDGLVDWCVHGWEDVADPSQLEVDR